jgi:hypothetical protein
LEALCKVRKEILQNLPMKCGHCDYPHKHSLGSFVEIDFGTLMAYCKTKGVVENLKFFLLQSIEAFQPINRFALMRGRLNLNPHQDHQLKFLPFYCQQIIS